MKTQAEQLEIIALDEPDYLPEKYQIEPWTQARKSKEAAFQIAFYATEQDAENGRLTRTHWKKYTQRLGTTDQDSRSAFLLQLIEYGIIELVHATSRADIRRIYEHGPGSCCGGTLNDEQKQHARDIGIYESLKINGAHRKTPDWFPNTRGLDIHPVEVYAAGDIEIVALQTDKHKYSARTVASIKNKRFYRVYSESSEYEIALNSLLSENGYKGHSDPLSGCRLLRLRGNDTLIAPYLDGGPDYGVADYDADHVVVTDDYRPGYLGSAQTATYNQSGGIRECEYEREYVSCSYCGQEYDPDDSEILQIDVVTRTGAYSTRECCPQCEDEAMEDYFTVPGRRRRVHVEALSSYGYCLTADNEIIPQEFAAEDISGSIIDRREAVILYNAFDGTHQWCLVRELGYWILTNSAACFLTHKKEI